MFEIPIQSLPIGLSMFLISKKIKVSVLFFGKYRLNKFYKHSSDEYFSNAKNKFFALIEFINDEKSA